jgi:hypothetical protein
MNWKLVALLSVFGPVLGTLTVLGVFPEGADKFVWSVVVGVCAFTVAKREPTRAVQHGAVIGFINGAASTLIQALWVDTLTANNPWMLEAMADQPAGFDFEFFVFMLVPFIGVAGGAMTGLLAMLMARALASRDAARKP